jgi:hypothetical protein
MLAPFEIGGSKPLLLRPRFVVALRVCGEPAQVESGEKLA